MGHADHNLDRWLGKWEFILRNDVELSKVGANIALGQLERIVNNKLEHR